MTNHKALFERHESQVRSYCRRFDALFVRSSGSVLFDSAGRRYVDFLAGCGALNYGHNDSDMADALVAHVRQQGLAMSMDLHSDVKYRFIDMLVRNVLAPRGLPYRIQFTGPTGTNAIEAALKLARRVTGRHNVVAFTNGFHGVSMGALAATGNRYNRMAQPFGNISRLPYDAYMGSDVDTASILEAMLDDPSGGVDAPAALLLELVQGEGGLNVACEAWLRRVFAAARRHGALVIVDDVQAGCGRTGGFFSFDAMNVVPDMVVLSKSISGFGLPMALLLMHTDHDQWLPAEHNGTFRGNNHAMLTGAVALEKFWSDDALTKGTEARAAVVRHSLDAMAQAVPGARVKGRGMMQGIDLRDGALAKRVSELAFERGLVIETAGPRDEVLKVLAPLNIPQPVLIEGLTILREALGVAMQDGSGNPVGLIKERIA